MFAVALTAAKASAVRGLACRCRQDGYVAGLGPLLEAAPCGGVHWVRVLAATLRSRASSMCLRSWSVRPVASVRSRRFTGGWKTGAGGCCPAIIASGQSVL